jgi:predicted Fe-S protein YdhL (DUF1289 family)
VASDDRTTVDSPCVRNCCLDDQDVCLGCGRSIAEILEWGPADQPRRREILRQASERLAVIRRRR